MVQIGLVRIMCSVARILLLAREPPGIVYLDDLALNVSCHGVTNSLLLGWYAGRGDCLFVSRGN